MPPAKKTSVKKTGAKKAPAQTAAAKKVGAKKTTKFSERSGKRAPEIPTTTSKKSARPTAAKKKGK